MKKKLLAILPILCVLLCVFALGASAVTEEIDTAEEFAAMAMDGDYKLIADIKVTAPIGTEDAPFKGTFDGDGHTVTVEIDTTGDGVGLFGYVDGGATIKNLTVKGSVKSDGAHVGGIIGIAEIKNDSAVIIENCKNYASVEGDNSVGGIVGRFRLSSNTLTGEHKIVGCANYGDVSGTGNSGMVGGIVGILTNGNNSGTLATMLVDNCYNKGAINAGAPHVGGIVGFFRNYTENKNTLTNCMNSGAISGSNNVGGIVGQVAQKPQIITACYNSGSVTATSGSADAIAVIDTAATGSAIEYTYYWQESGTSSIGTEVTTANYGVAGTFTGFSTDYWIFAGDGPMLRSFLELDTVIGSEEELLLLMAASDKWALSYTLARDLDMAAEDLYETTKTATHTPIGNSTTPFTGSFDGQNHTISGLSITGTVAGTGFFGVVGGAGSVNSAVTIKNLTVAGEVDSTADAVGGIVGQFATAENASLIIENCVNNCNVSTTTAYAGGIIGHVDGTAKKVTLTITGCVNNGDITATGNVAGGILGYYNNRNQSSPAAEEYDGVTVTKCKNTGAIYAVTYAGGVVGAFYGQNKVNYANITLTELYNNNKSQLIEVPQHRGTIIGYIRNVAGGVYTISDLHDRAEPIQETVSGYLVYHDEENRDHHYYTDSSQNHYMRTENDGTYTEWEAVETVPEKLNPHWSNGCAPIGNVAGFDANGLKVTRVVAEMALFISGSSNSSINVEAYAFGYADHMAASRPYAYTDLIFKDREVNGEDNNKWVMTWSGPMLKAFAENVIDGISYESAVVENTDADDGRTYTGYSAKLTISTAEDLIKFMNCHRLWDLDITLGDDIDLSAYGTADKQYYEGYENYGDATRLLQMPIGRSLEKKFSGTFDGNEKTISGLNITYDETSGTGLFGTVEGRIVGTETNPDKVERNVHVPVIIKRLTVGGSVTNNINSRAGGIVGQVLAPLEMTDCISNVAVTAKTGSAGGIIGTYAASNGSYVTITRCYNSGAVKGTSYVGGIVGYLAVAEDEDGNRNFSEKLTITSCNNFAKVEGSDGGVGGIMGAAVTGSYQAAGGEGFVKITSCTNVGTVNARYYAGGMLGYIHKREDCNPIRMSYEFTECTNNGAVTTSGNTAEDGTVSGGSAAAGIVGFVRLASNNNFTVDECVNNAAINGVGRSGGIVGYIHNYREEKKSDVTDSEGDGAGGDDVGSEGDGDALSVSTEGDSTTDSGSTGETDTMHKYYTSNVTYTITNCTNNGAVTVDGNTVVGGILGYYANMGYPDTTDATGGANKLIITYCKNEGTITATKTNDKSAYVGGIVGTIGSNLNNSCHAQVTVNTVYNAGKVVGDRYVGTVFGCIRPLAKDTFTADDGTVVTYESSYTITDVHGGGSSAMPVVGTYGSSTVGGPVVFEYTRVYAENYNELVGLYNGHTIKITDCITDANNILQLYEFVENSSATNTWVMTKTGPMLAYFAGGITGYKEYTVSTPENLIYLMNTPALWGATVTLAADVDLTGVADQAPIGNSHIGFMGTFIGNNHTISGLNLSGSDNVGLFGYVEGYGQSTSYDDEGYGQGESYVGATISDLTVSGTVTSTSDAADNNSIGAGGIIGKANGVRITNCENNVAVNGVNCVGGVAGILYVGGLDIYPLTYNENSAEYKNMPEYNAGETVVRECKNTADITATGARVGGIAGFVYGVNKDAVASLTKNANSGDIEADQMAGGLVGRLDNTFGTLATNNKYDIHKFHNTGSVTVVNGCAGGLVGILTVGADKTDLKATIIVDTILNGSNLCNRDSETGAITSTGTGDDYVGGIVGYTRNYYGDASILNYSNLMNTGAVNSSRTNGDIAGVGGIFGIANVGSGLYTAENLYNRGSVTTPTGKRVGSIVAAYGNALSNGLVKDLYAYNANNETFSRSEGVNFVSADMLGYSEAFTQNSSDAYYSLTYNNGLAPFEVAYTKLETLPETYENWIMTSEGAELSYYHEHDEVTADGTIICICIPEEKKALSFRVTLLSEYVLEYTVPYVAGETNPRMVFTSTDADGYITTTVAEPVTYATSGANNETDFAKMYEGSGTSKYYFKVPGIAGKEMADTITGTFYYGEGEDMCRSNTVTGNLITYYQVAYAAYSGLDSTVATTLTTLLNAMVNYGAAAQEYFSYNTENLATTEANAPKVDYTITTVDINEEDAKATQTAVDGQTYTFYKQAANLDQRISTVLYFTYTGDTPDLTDLTFKGSYFNVTGALITFRVEGSAMELVELDGQNVVAVYVDRPAAKDLRVEFTGALYSAGNQVSDKVTTSFECYAQAVENDTAKSENLRALCRSILAYSDAAKAYFDAYWDNVLTDAENQ